MIITELIEQLKAMPEKMEGRNGEGESVVLNTHKLAESLKKSLRNCDKYRTAKDAFAGFNKMCEEKKCSTCPFSAERNECLNCNFNWLFAEAEKEVSK